jgi:sulfoxide reductase heme-binding subunit YedZ
MKKTLEWINKNKILFVVNIILLLPLFGLLSSFEINFSGEGSILSYNTPENVIQMLKEGGKSFTQLWLPIHSTGEWAIRLFMFTLTCTPLTILFGWNTKRYRKLFGIYTFIYSVFHLLFFLVDYGILGIFDEFNFILGMIATIIIIPLGITSNKWSMSILRKNWVKLQKLAYPAAVLAVLHVVFLENGAWQVYGYGILIGFVLRINSVKIFIRNLRSKKVKLAESV